MQVTESREGVTQVLEGKPTTVPPAPSVPTNGRPLRIGKYDIIADAGRGSTGSVYLSHDSFYGRDVAIKLYNAVPDGDTDKLLAARKMFLSEARMVGMLQHPNILPIYDAGEEQGRCYVVTEFVHGARTLAAYCKPDNLLPIDDVVELMYKCAKALGYAHGRGVIHRDIKPSNIMLTVDNNVRIIDFGIALVAGNEDSRLDGIAGSPAYMCPEQLQSLPLTNRADLYSLGTVMYELLTGFRPFRGGDLARLMHQIVYATPPPIHTLREGIPEDLEAVVAKAMHKDPDQRFRTGEELAVALSRIHQSLRRQTDRMDQQERFALLRKLGFFNDFSHAEIWEVLRGCQWQSYVDDEEIVAEGEIDDRFYVIVEGEVRVERLGARVGRLAAGQCFGETGYLQNAKRMASICANGSVTVMKLSATMLEQLSAPTQLRFTKAFLRSIIGRLQGGPSGRD
jgi:serine/threonine protein kinase